MQYSTAEFPSPSLPAPATALADTATDAQSAQVMKEGTFETFLSVR